MALTASTYLTLAVAVERYTTVCHPFFKVRFNYTTKVCEDFTISEGAPTRAILDHLFQLLRGVYQNSMSPLPSVYHLSSIM